MRNYSLAIVAAVAMLTSLGCESNSTSDSDKAQAEATSAEESPESEPGTARSPAEGDDPEAKSSDELTTTHLSVKEMFCGGCEKAVESKLGDLPGVSEVSASADENRAEVTYDAEKVQPDRFVEALSDVQMQGQEMSWEVEVLERSE